MKKILLFISLITFCFLGKVKAQQTVGLFLNTESAVNGYTLFSPLGNTQTFLIDNCGNLVKLWNSEYMPGSVTYLLPSGNLLRTGRIVSDVFNAGGIGGRIELFNWEGELMWELNAANENYHQHHDIEHLPNGNLLVLNWEYKSPTEVAAAGRVVAGELWPTYIFEIAPEGSEGGNIVWEWHLWDHTVQDVDPTLPNFGVISEHPERVNVNFNSGIAGPSADWAHCNAIAYNAQLDQIIISSRNFNECWIIDHSTTTEEAASNTGGNMGKGGDILYRWGNPATYNRGSLATQRFFLQHDTYWIPEGYPDAGKIMVFNNGMGRPGGNFSSVEIIDPPVDAQGNYFIADDAPFGPFELSWLYIATPPLTFYSQNVSGAQRLANGNTLICEGRSGRFFEINYIGNIIWEYQNPVGAFGPVSQGTPVVNNSVFRAYRYTPDYPAFEGKELSAGAPIEFDPLPSDCEIFDEIVGIDEAFDTYTITLMPNPARNYITITANSNFKYHVNVFNLQGKQIHSTNFSDNLFLNIEDWVTGIYVVQTINTINNKVEVQKLVKQ